MCICKTTVHDILLMTMTQACPCLDLVMSADDDKTIAKTIWSETLIDILLVALKKNSPDDEIIKLLKDLQRKGFKKFYLIDKVTKEVDEAAGRRVRRLFS